MLLLRNQLGASGFRVLRAALARLPLGERVFAGLARAVESEEPRARRVRSASELRQPLPGRRALV
jgi:hypothetical protein